MPKKSVPAVKEEKKVPAKNLGGRPSIYTLKLAEDICRVIGSDTRGLKVICSTTQGFPSADTVNVWRYDHPEFDVMMDKAQALQAKRRVEEAHEIAEDTSRDMYMNKEGCEVPNAAAIARDRLRIDNRKYMASKLAAAIYGDKTQNEITVIRHEDTIEALK